MIIDFVQCRASSSGKPESRNIIMWKLKIAEGNGPYLYSTNNFVGRQIWEFEPNAGTPEEREEVEKARDYYLNNRRQGVHPCGDMLMRMQVIKHIYESVSSTDCPYDCR